MARSGIAASILLNKHGANVTLQDIKNNDIPNEIKGTTIKIYQGKQPNEIINDFDVIVLSPGIPYDAPFVKQAIKLGKYVIGEFELGAQFYKGPIYAITGTNGKTTTTMIAAHIISKVKEVTLAGNIGEAITSQIKDVPTTCIAEVSSFQLETIDKFSPKIAAVLNLTEDHLDRHYTMENYCKIKERIFLNQGLGDYVILNYKDNYTRYMANHARSKVIFFNCEKNLNKLENGAYFNKIDNSIVVVISGQWHTFSTYKFCNNLKGYHNIENAMVAIIIALLAKVNTEVIQLGLDTFVSPPHRLEYVREINGVHFYNDSKATNPTSCIVSISSIKGGIILIAGGVVKEVDYEELNNTISRNVKKLILIGKDEQKLMSKFKNYELKQTLEEAVKTAMQYATVGDNILFSPACASFDMFKDYVKRGEAFKEIVNSLVF